MPHPGDALRLARAAAAAVALAATPAAADDAVCWSAVATTEEGEAHLLALHPRAGEEGVPRFVFTPGGAIPSGDVTLRVGNRTIPMARAGGSAAVEDPDANRHAIDSIDYATQADVFVSVYERGQIPAATFAFPTDGFERAIYADPKRCL